MGNRAKWVHRRQIVKAARKALAMPSQRVSRLVGEIFARYPESKPLPNRYAVLKWFVDRHGRDYGVEPIRTPRETDEFYKTREWRYLRMRVIKTRGARCECCGANPSDGITVIHVDHVKPRQHYPELALNESNLQVLCENCNIGKGAWDKTDWRKQQAPTMAPRLVKRVLAS